jgi:hypothetical protein
MDEAAITRFITETFSNVEAFVASGDTYFFHHPDPDSPDRRFPFATLVTGDRHDTASNLDRPGIFRLNVGVSKQTFQSLFPTAGDHDHTALDRIMPHPVYGNMYWLCVLNPSPETFQTVKALLAEAHERAGRRGVKE